MGVRVVFECIHDLPSDVDIASKLAAESFFNVSYSVIFTPQGRNFEASLRSNGLIESAGGETFRTPMAWMRAVTGSWNTIKQSHAYKMVNRYKIMIKPTQ